MKIKKLVDTVVTVGGICGAMAVLLIDAALEQDAQESQAKEAEELLKRRKEAEAKRSNKELSFFDTLFAVENTSYSDTVKCIVESDMFDTSKTKLIGMIPKNITSEEAKVVIAIIDSDMFDSGKIAAITNVVK